MHRVVYVSDASRTIRRADVTQIVETSRRNNAETGLTGVLIYFEGRFFQVLEGPYGMLRASFGKIAKDRRHRNVAIIEHLPVSERAFPDWRMGYAEPAELPEELREHIFRIYDLIPRNSPERGGDPRVRDQLRDFLAGFKHFRPPEPRAVAS